MEILVNVDNGGTFTDVCVTNGERVVHAKTATTPHDLTRCFVDGLRAVSDRLYGEEDLIRLLRAEYLRYSTTSGTNAVVERKGTPVALLVDSGAEEDVYGILELVDAGRPWCRTRPSGSPSAPTSRSIWRRSRPR
jgi:N-methylhydantoinase A